MKAILASILLFVASTLTMFAADMTGGVFYIDTPVECRLISQNGSAVTNQLVAGKTYMVLNEGAITELTSTNQTTYYLSGGLLIEAMPSSVFSVDVFDQEVKNLSAQPRKAEFGTHNISVTFTRGEFTVIYPSTDVNSTLTINTPYATYQVSGGKYFFRISDKSSIAFVGDGIMQVHGEKNKVDKTEKGKLALAVPFQDPTSGLSDKIITSIKTAKQDETDRFSSPITMAEKKLGSVQFVVINNRVIGIWTK